MDMPDIPDFLRRKKGEPSAWTTYIAPSTKEQDRWRDYEAHRKAHRKVKARGRVAKMKALAAEREALASGKHFDVKTGRWV